MGDKDDKFLETLRATFRIEAAEHLQTIATGLLELEKAPGADAGRELVANVFRAAHSLKGAARAVDFEAVESLCQALEDRFAVWKREGRSPSPSEFDSLHVVLNAIEAALSPAAPKPAAPSAAPPPSAAPWSAEEPGRAGAPPPEREHSSLGGTVRIPVAKLDARLLAAEEMLTTKLAAGRMAADLRELAQLLAAWHGEWAAVEPETRALRQAIGGAAAGEGPKEAARLLEFLGAALDRLKSLEGRVAALARTADQDRHAVGRLVGELLQDSKKLLLLPFATLTAPFPKLVRDLCRDQGKEAELTIRGEDFEVDKRILEEMKDPLIHLLRNCIDHGIEKPEARLRRGKPARAALTVAASGVNGSKMEILVSDDGAGFDVDKLKDAAVRQGVLSAADASGLGDAEARALAFQPEISTSAAITSVSGRGLGLAIVREKAEKLGGTVDLESEPGRGSRFRITLPSMLATFRGILVEASGRTFVIPTTQVERVARAGAAEVRTVEGRETIALDGRTIAWARLAGLLELPASGTEGAMPDPTPVVVLGAGDQRVAVAVDAILDEQEVLVKRLAKPLLRVRHVAGATVLATGQVAPILSVTDLLRSARKGGAPAARSPAAPRHAEAKSILVAEDSITSRSLIKGILESAGYKVTTAVDGVEAFALLRTEKFDLVVSDVEMPRLSGFDLAARIRADKKLAELPVILVTALDTREDRERGIDVGANAYIVKSRFDQSNLLEAVQRLA